MLEYILQWKFDTYIGRGLLCRTEILEMERKEAILVAKTKEALFPLENTLMIYATL